MPARTMKVLMVAYCIGDHEGQSLIGVYKRALRVALELCDRGHEVSVFCSGREGFHDEMTELAERRMSFVEWPFEAAVLEGAETNRRRSLEHMRRLDPDVVVIGEAPLAGALLELTLCAAELEIPVVCLDNAYHPVLVQKFLAHHGAMYDGVILTGASSFHARDVPSHVLQVAPFIEPSGDEARDLLVRKLGLTGRRLMTVMAYDRSVEALGTSILTQLEDPELEAVFLTHRKEACRARLESLPDGVRERLRVISPLPDSQHFGLCQISRLVVGKCAFMQMSECLSLRTPIIGFYFEGDFKLELIPEVCHDFAYATSDADAGADVLAVSRRFLDLTPEDMVAVHDGVLEAATRAAQFLEALPEAPRSTVTADSADQGLTPEQLLPALRHLHPDGRIEILSTRLSLLREPRELEKIFAVLCRYTVDGDERVERLWRRTFGSPEAAQEDAREARQPESRRQLYCLGAEESYLIERDVGAELLPEVKML